MAAVTICSDFGTPENKVCNYFHCFPIYLPWSDGTRCHDLSFLNTEGFFFFQSSFKNYWLIDWFYFTILYWFSHTLTWIWHECTCVPHPESPSHLPPYLMPLGHPSVPAPSILYHASHLDWRFISHMIFYMFQCYTPISFRSCPLPQSPKDCLIHLFLLSYIQGYHYHLSEFHIYALV